MTPKPKELVEDPDGNDYILILRARNTGVWLNKRCTTLIGTLLEATQFRDFFSHVMMLPP